MKSLLAVALILALSPAAAAQSGDGLDEVNAKRAARGLRPFARDEGLTAAAFACAEYRARHRMFGHTANDFAFVPAGTRADSAGCAAYPASYGWLSCCAYENYTHAGAAWVTGGDGRRYMHLYVRSGGPAPAAPAVPVVVAVPQEAPKADAYADVYARVARGERVTWEGAPPGLPFGVYDCRLVNGVPVMRLCPGGT